MFDHALKSFDAMIFITCPNRENARPPGRAVRKRHSDAFRHRSLVRGYKFPHVSSRFMDNFELRPSCRNVRRGISLLNGPSREFSEARLRN